MMGFGPLLKRLRGEASLREIGRRTGLSWGYLAKVESGARRPSERRIASILKRAFGLGEREIGRVLLEMRFQDCGLEDGSVRAFLASFIEGSLPGSARDAFLLMASGAPEARRKEGEGG